MGIEQTTQNGPKMNFFSTFFYSHQGAMQYKNNYENDSH